MVRYCPCFKDRLITCEWKMSLHSIGIWPPYMGPYGLLHLLLHVRFNLHLNFYFSDDDNGADLW